MSAAIGHPLTPFAVCYLPIYALSPQRMQSACSDHQPTEEERQDAAEFELWTVITHPHDA